MDTFSEQDSKLLSTQSDPIRYTYLKTVGIRKYFS